VGKLKKNLDGKQEVQFDGEVFSSGFGIIAQNVMRDPRLTPGAKGFYGYLCSFAGAGKTAFPSRETILSEMGVSKNTYWGWTLELQKYGYIKVITRTAENLPNLFIILATPEPDPSIETLKERRKPKDKPSLKNYDEGAGLKISDEPSLKNCDEASLKILDEASLKICDIENKHIKITHKNNTIQNGGAKRTLEELNSLLKERGLEEISNTKKAQETINKLLSLDEDILDVFITRCVELKTADKIYESTVDNPIAFVISHPDMITKIIKGDFPRKKQTKKVNKYNEDYPIYVPKFSNY
jgi:hypothetical protein